MRWHPYFHRVGPEILVGIWRVPDDTSLQPDGSHMPPVWHYVKVEFK